MQMLTDIAIDPAGDVWVADNWHLAERRFGKPPEAQLAYCGGNGLTVFYGMAKPVRVPLIAPPRAVSGAGDRRDFCRSYPGSGCKTAHRRSGPCASRRRPAGRGGEKKGLRLAQGRPLFRKLDNLLLCAADLDAAYRDRLGASPAVAKRQSGRLALPDTDAELVIHINVCL